MRGFNLPLYVEPAGAKMECFEGNTFFVAFKVRARFHHPTNAMPISHASSWYRPSPALLASNNAHVFRGRNVHRRGADLMQDMLLFLSALAVLKETHDLAHRLTIAMSLNYQLAAVEEPEVPQQSPTALKRTLSLMGLAPTPTEARQSMLVRLLVFLTAPCPRSRLHLDLGAKGG